MAQCDCLRLSHSSWVLQLHMDDCHKLLQYLLSPGSLVTSDLSIGVALGHLALQSCLTLHYASCRCLVPTTPCLLLYSHLKQSHTVRCRGSCAHCLCCSKHETAQTGQDTFCLYISHEWEAMNGMFFAQFLCKQNETKMVFFLTDFNSIRMVLCYTTRYKKRPNSCSHRL